MFFEPDFQTTARPGDPVDLAPFARVRWWMGSQRHDLQAGDIAANGDGSYTLQHDAESGEWRLGLEWDEPQTVCRAVIRFSGQTPPPGLRLDYWRQHWPTIAPERLRGARRGWIGRDDPWHGVWTTVRAACAVDGNSCSFTFDPLDAAEITDWRKLDEAEDYHACFRRTLKLRLVAGGEAAPAVQSIQAFSPAVWRRISMGLHFPAEGNWDGQAEVSHGYLSRSSAWVSIPPLQPGPPQRQSVSLPLLYAQGDPSCGDRTIVTVRTHERSFSFLARDLESGPIYIKDYGVLIADDADTGDEAMMLPAILARYDGAVAPLYDRVPLQPEQTLQRALAEIPPLDVTKQESYRVYQEDFGLYMILGLPAGRQEFGLRYNGEVFISKPLLKPSGRDLAKVCWPGMHIRFRFGGGDPPDFREGSHACRQSCREGWMPVYRTEWSDREVQWTQTAFAAPLHGPAMPADECRGDEDMVAMLRFTLRNASPSARRAQLWLDIDPQEDITLDGSYVVSRGRVVPDEPLRRQWRVQPYDTPRLRCALRPGCGKAMAVSRPGGEGARSFAGAIVYEVELAPGHTDVIDIAIPFPSLSHAADWAQAAALSYDTLLDDVTQAWRKQVLSGGAIELPDTILNDLHKAVQAHVAISGDKDVTSGLTVLPPGSWSYGACGNEAAWQITMLDQAGQHKEAERYLEIFLRTQGAAKPDGRFQSSAGALQGLDLDDGRPKPSQFGYNLDHGVIMECLATHYRLSGDDAWLQRVIPYLAAACEFVAARAPVDQDTGCRRQACGRMGFAACRSPGR